MIALSLHQPWASLFVSGAKQYETRDHPLPRTWQLPCVVAIHAALRWTREMCRMAKGEPFCSALEAAGVKVELQGGRRGGSIPRGNLPLGCVVGAVRFVECHDTSALASASGQHYPVPEWMRLLTEQELAFGDYSLGRFAWLTDARVRFKRPVPCAGRQGPFNWEPTAEALEELAALMPAAQPEKAQ